MSSPVATGWSIVVRHPAGAFVAAKHTRWLDAYLARPPLERVHQCKVTIEDSESRDVRSLPHIEQNDSPQPNLPMGRQMARPA
jgi:hypothetical protein